MPRLPAEEKEKQYRAIYEILCKKPRTFKNELADLLHVNRDTASDRLNEAVNSGWLSKTQIRKRSFENLREYTYLLRCNDPVTLFSEFADSEDIIYHALISGPFNLWVVSEKEMEFECDTVVGGPRSDYYISYAPHQSSDHSIQKMHDMVSDFNAKDYRLEETMKNHFDEVAKWDKEYEALFEELKYDLRKPVSEILRKNCISWRKLDQWMRDIPKYCTIMTGYYPGTISSYDPYLYMFETDYEDFLISLFSELPTSTVFFRVSGRLLVDARVKRQYVRFLDAQVHISELQIPLLVRELLGKGIVKSESHGMIECYWMRGLYPGIPPGPSPLPPPHGAGAPHG